MTFEQVANLVSTRTFAISSRFRPTYNMAANLVRRYEPGEAHHLLNLSFAQYQADRDIVRIETRLERTDERIASSREQLVCDRGNCGGKRPGSVSQHRGGERSHHTPQEKAEEEMQESF